MFMLRSLISSFFQQSHISLAVRCRTFKLKFLAVAEKMVKNFSGLLFLLHPVDLICFPVLLI